MYQIALLERSLHYTIHSLWHSKMWALMKMGLLSEIPPMGHLIIRNRCSWPVYPYFVLPESLEGTTVSRTSEAAGRRSPKGGLHLALGCWVCDIDVRKIFRTHWSRGQESLLVNLKSESSYSLFKSHNSLYSSLLPCLFVVIFIVQNCWPSVFHVFLSFAFSGGT
jgi:hypothetical protein